MAALDKLTADVATETGTLPSWFTAAQQNVVNQAANIAPTPVSQTTLGAAAQPFAPGGAFGTAQDILSSIGSGAANPWFVSTDATGKQTVTPNVNTALGGLFQAQQQQLAGLTPSIDVEATAPYIGAGGFGSSMNLAAIERERAKAAANMFSQQNQAALQALQSGTAAGAGLGTLGQNVAQSGVNVANAQLGAPYVGATDYATILAKLQQPTSKTTVASPSLFSTIASGTTGLMSPTGQKVLENLGSAGGNILNTLGIGKMGKSILDYLSGKSAPEDIPGYNWDPSTETYISNETPEDTSSSGFVPDEETGLNVVPNPED